jgi:hypothetical protein
MMVAFILVTGGPSPSDLGAHGLGIWHAHADVTPGLTFSFIFLFPLWGPPMARRAAARLNTAPSEQEAPYFRSEMVERSSDWFWAVIYFLVILFFTSMLADTLLNILQPPPLSLIIVGSYLPVTLSLVNARARIRLRRKRRRRSIEAMHAKRLKQDVCPRCEYSLTGNISGRCPECAYSFANTEVTEPVIS